MTAKPDHNLTLAMLLRAGDLAAYMLDRGQSVAVASGKAPNGHPCTVIMAIGDDAEAARQIGERMCMAVADAAEQAKTN
jgi:ABC-type nitrate/sulfonate/bicarbonate transport system substrate-binding protein